MKTRKNWIKLTAILPTVVTVLAISRLSSNENRKPTAVLAQNIKAPIIAAASPVENTQPTPAMLSTSSVAHVLSNQAFPAAYSSRFLRLQPAQIAVLGMTQEQLKIAQEVYDKNVRTRLGMEGDLAMSTKVNERETIIDVPAYAATKNLETEFYRDLSARLGETTANKIKTSLGMALRAENGGYGVQPQILFVTAIDSTSWEIVHKSSTSDGTTMTKTHDVSPNDLGSYIVFSSLFPQLPTTGNRL